MISQTIFAVSDDESRPIHTGSLFVVDEEGLTMVAVDGFRLALRKEPILEKNGNFEFVVPGASLSEVEKICRETDDPVDVHQGARHVLFKMGDTILIAGGWKGVPGLAPGHPQKQPHQGHGGDQAAPLLH